MFDNSNNPFEDVREPGDGADARAALLMGLLGAIRGAKDDLKQQREAEKAEPKQPEMTARDLLMLLNQDPTVQLALDMAASLKRLMETNDILIERGDVDEKRRRELRERIHGLERELQRAHEENGQWRERLRIAEARSQNYDVKFWDGLMPMLAAGLETAVPSMKVFLNEGDKIAAIKEVRIALNWGLKEAKEMVDAYIRWEARVAAERWRIQAEAEEQSEKVKVDYQKAEADIIQEIFEQPNQAVPNDGHPSKD